MTAEAIAIIGAAVALLAVLVPLLLTIRADVRRLDDRLHASETRLDGRLRTVEARLDDRLHAIDARLRNVETGLAFLRGRLQEDGPEIEPEPTPAEPAPARQAARSALFDDDGAPQA